MTDFPEQTHLSVNMNSTTAASLNDFMDQKGVNATEAMRRIIDLGVFMDKTIKEGKRIIIHEHRGWWRGACREYEVKLLH